MAKIKIRFFVARARFGRPEHWWQPSSELRAEGWRPKKLAADRAAAIEEAEAINARVDAWRRDRRVATLAAGAEPQAAPAPAPMAAPRARELGRTAGPAAKARPGSVAWLIDEYRKDELFRRCAPKTRLEYDKHLDTIRAWAGDEPAGAIRREDVRKLYRDHKARAPAMAAAMVRVGRRLWSVGTMLAGAGVAENPWARLSIEGGGKAGLVWPREAVDWMVAAADALGASSVGTAIALNEWIGQRQGDVLRLPATFLERPPAIRQRKRGSVARLDVRDVPAVVARLKLQRARDEAAAAGGTLTASTLLVDERTGRPWTEDAFRKRFAEIRAAAAEAADGGVMAIDWQRPGFEADDPRAWRVSLTELQFAHLRHTAVVRLNEASVDPLGIRTITGHSLRSVDQILETYAIATGATAKAALAKRLAHEGG